jgi:hypothetical protein
MEIMRLFIFALVAALTFVPAATADEAVGNGLTVHEWGVFRVNEDAAFANADLRAEWDDLPDFAYGHLKGRAVPQHWGAFEERAKPIIFFHAQKPLTIRVNVGFPGGMAGVWFPATESPAIFGFDKQPAVGGSLQWNLGVKNCPNGWQPKNPTVPVVADKHWISRVRKVKSDEIFARFSPSNLDVEREKFIYYDGIFPQARWVKFKVAGARVSLASGVKHPVFDVTIVDRRSEKVRVGRVAKLGAGESVAEVAFVEVDPSQFPKEGAVKLVEQLSAAGLNQDEAKSLVDIWHQRMFETPGLTAFYRLPQEQYDVLMPLAVTPKAESMARVGLIYHGHLEPDFADRVLELVKKLDALKFADRDAAMKKLLAIGPAALVQIQRFRERPDLSAEVRDRLDSLVKKWSTKEALEQ